jgi:pre-mRNA-splicing factor 18
VEKKILPRVEVMRRLRDRGHPIRLFGETDEDSAKRLNIIESRETSSFGMRNDFKTAMDKSEQESLNEIMNSIDGEHHSEQHANAEQDELDDESFIDEIKVYIRQNKTKQGKTNSSCLHFFSLVFTRKWLRSKMIAITIPCWS